MPSPSPRHALLEALSQDDLVGAQEALRAGASPNAEMPPGVSDYGQTPLRFVLDRASARRKSAGSPASHGLMDLVRLLVDSGARILPPESQGPGQPRVRNSVAAHHLGFAAMSLGQEWFEFLRGLLPSAPDLPSIRVMLSGESFTLADLAVRGGDLRLAMALWKQGVLPHPASAPDDEDRPVSSPSTLVLAVGSFRRHAEFAHRHLFWERLLGLAWPQDDLDAALVQALRKSVPLKIVEDLLGLGARPSRPVRVDEGELSAATQWLGGIGVSPREGAWTRLVGHGLDVNEKMSFHFSRNGTVSRLTHDRTRLERLPRPDDPSHLPDRCEDAGLVHLAVASAHPGVLGEMIASGLDVNARTGEGLTPLHLACLRHPDEAIVYDGDSCLGRLMEAGACVDALDARSCTPVEYWALTLGCNDNSQAPAHIIALARRLAMETLEACPNVRPRLEYALSVAGANPVAQAMLEVCRSRHMAQSMDHCLPDASPARPARL